MEGLVQELRNLVIGNRILAHEGVVDAFGHISVRHPDNPERFLMSRSRSPELVSFDDLMEFTLDGEPVDARGRTAYSERYIHAAILEARPDVNSVVHNHAYEVIPFGVTGVRLRPMFHTAARMGAEVPVWDIRDKWGDTHLLVVNMDHGRDLARTLADNSVVLMRGHGCTVVGDSIRHAVGTAIYTQINARLQMQAMQMGDITYLSQGEIDIMAPFTAKAALGRERAWEYWRRRAGCEDL